MFLQVAVHEHDGHGALADGGGDPLGRLGPRVAGHEHAGDAGLQVVGRAVKFPAAWAGPPVGALTTLAQVGAGQHEAALIARHDPVEPVGERGGADEDEQQLRVDGLGGAGRAVAQRQALR
jgi:hypothetical protein